MDIDEQTLILEYYPLLSDIVREQYNKDGIPKKFENDRMLYLTFFWLNYCRGDKGFQMSKPDEDEREYDKKFQNHLIYMKIRGFYDKLFAQKYPGFDSFSAFDNGLHSVDKKYRKYMKNRKYREKRKNRKNREKQHRC